MGDRLRRRGAGGLILTLKFEVGDRFVEAAEEWGDGRLMDPDEALRTKTEQALLEIEHLVTKATDVDFVVEGRTIHYDPSEELYAFLASQAADTGLDPETVLKLHVDLFARAFLDDDKVRPTDGDRSDGLST